MGTPVVRHWPRHIALAWLLSSIGSLLALAVCAWLAQSSVVFRQYIGQWSALPAWISIAACVLLLYLSKPKDAEVVSRKAQAASVFVAGGLLTALVLQFGLVPRWLAAPSALGVQLQIGVMLLIHVLCAWFAWRKWDVSCD